MHTHLVLALGRQKQEISVSSRPTLPAEPVPGQPRQHRASLSQKISRAKEIKHKQKPMK